LSNFIRTSSLVLVLVCAAAFAGLAQEKKQPKKNKKEAPEVIASVIKLPAEYNTASWKKFESQRGGFSVLFPGTPEEDTQKVAEDGQEVVVRVLKFKALAEYTVMYLDIPAGQTVNVEAARKVLDASARQAFEMFQATPLEQKEITLDGHPGLSYVVRLPEGVVMRLRAYAAPGRLYQLMILTPSEQGATDDQRRFYEATANKFLDSFTLAPVRGASVIGPVGPVAQGGVRGAPVSAPKKLPRAPISAGVFNGKAVSKPAPAYPAAAVKERVEGVVSVAIVIDEEGKVMAAEAVGGPELLREAAVAAALKSRFSITRLSGQPVKVSGIVTYNFVLR
jgi:TonB family protein